MKNILKYKIGVTLMVITLLTAGCIDEPPEIGEPFNRSNDLVGTWELKSVIQRDEVAVSKGFPLFVQSIDLTERAGFVDYQIVINGTDGSLTTFSEQNGVSPSVVGAAEGNAVLDDPDVPTEITFEGADTSTTLAIDSYVGLKEGILTLRITKELDGAPTISYVYNFNKVTN